jgi:hypothetical protein
MQWRSYERAIGIGLAACLCLVVWALPVPAQEPAYGTAAEELASKIAAAFPVVSGRVIGLERERILLDLGAKDKVIPGLELQVYREGQEFKHPYTGQILGKLDRDVGRVRIMEVHPNFCVAEIIQQSEGTLVQQGDSVRVTSARIVLALPNVDVADVSGTNTRSVTRDLTNALIKTNRFEVLADQRIRAALAEEKMPATDQWGDPAVLQALWKRLRVSAVLFAKLSLLEKMVRWDVQVLSTVRGDTVTLASAEVLGVAPKFAGGSGRPAGAGGSREVARIDMVATRTQELPFKGQAMAAGELTGDGTTKLAMSDGQNIYIYDLTKTGIKPVITLPGQTTDNVIWLEAADINGNGVAEIFVSNYTLNGLLRSYVLEYQGGKFVRIADDLPLYFRVLQGPDGKPELYAQTHGNREPFGGPVRRYSWQGNRYAPAPFPPVSLPKAYPNIFGFGLADLNGDGTANTLVLDHMDYLRIFERGGGEIYRSSDHFGGSELILEYDPTTAQGVSKAGIQSIQLMIQGRMLFQDVMGDGKKLLILPRNTPSTGYIFKTRLYDKGKIFGLQWDGVGVQEVWQTREFPGYVADYALVEPEGTGDKKLVILVVQTNLLGMTKSRSGLVILDMKR